MPFEYTPPTGTHFLRIQNCKKWQERFICWIPLVMATSTYYKHQMIVEVASE